MKRSRRMKKDRAKRLPSVEEYFSGQVTDDDNSHITIDVEEARRELRKLAEVKDEPPQETVSTEEADAYILSFFKKEGE
jgi:hypothetical protein